MTSLDMIWKEASPRLVMRCGSSGGVGWVNVGVFSADGRHDHSVHTASSGVGGAARPGGLPGQPPSFLLYSGPPSNAPGTGGHAQ